MPLLARSILLSVCVLCAGAALAGAASRPSAAVGDYKGAPVLEEGGSYQSAVFSVTKDGAERTIVATEGANGIYYPDVGECDDEFLPLTADTVTVSPTARFKIRDKATLDDVEVLVIWKGVWKKAKRVTGTITIKSGGCSSTEQWTGTRLSKPAASG